MWKCKNCECDDFIVEVIKKQVIEDCEFDEYGDLEYGDELGDEIEDETIVCEGCRCSGYSIDDIAKWEE